MTVEEGLERTVRWYLDNEAWWRPLLAGRAWANGWARAAHERLLVFGRTGQVARELQQLARLWPWGAMRPIWQQPGACAAAIHAHRPRAVINAAAYTAVDRAEEEEAWPPPSTVRRLRKWPWPVLR